MVILWLDIAINDLLPNTVEHLIAFASYAKHAYSKEIDAQTREGAKSEICKRRLEESDGSKKVWGMWT